MDRYTVFILNLTHAGSTNGVDRHVGNLLAGLSETGLAGRLYFIELVLDSRRTLRKEETMTGYTKVTIPLPEEFGTVVNEAFWSDRFNNALYEMLEPYFDGAGHPVVHVQVLNLISLALVIKKHTGAQIVTHLHCIPWKNRCNTSVLHFNRLYRQYYQKKEYGENYFTGHTEKVAYEQCDKLIAVTESGRSFVRNVAGIPDQKIALLPNGLVDYCPGLPERDLITNRPARLLYVGWVNEGKGIFFILKALRRVIQAGYSIELTIAGGGMERNFERIRHKFADVPVRLLGSIPFDQLQEHYKNADIGIIGSLQEQNSYVAIEMAMFGLPIVTTAVDGLDEMFTDGADALKVPVRFDFLTGLSVDLDRMKEAVIELIASPEKRRRLSAGARRLYEQNYTLPKMTREVIGIYETMN